MFLETVRGQLSCTYGNRVGAAQPICANGAIPIAGAKWGSNLWFWMLGPGFPVDDSGIFSTEVREHIVVGSCKLISLTLHRFFLDLASWTGLGQYNPPTLFLTHRTGDLLPFQGG